MPVKFVDGDVFATNSDVALAHGCNCAGAMGKGIAVEFKRRWPEMYSIYKKKCKSSEFDCGDVFCWEDADSGRTIFNLGTQKTWRTKATLDAIESSLATMVTIASELEIKAVCMPMIGAGLGGLSVADVKKTMVEILDASSLSFLVCENYVAAKEPFPRSETPSTTAD